jgi:hypothetical protein
VKPPSTQVPGIVISRSPAASGCFIGSPSLAILPNGHYVASHDFFGPNANHTLAATTLVFVSLDKGDTWQQTATLKPCAWEVEDSLLYHRDTQAHAWQYIDWQFATDDIVLASRSAYNDGLGGAQSAHDARYFTFHRIMDFRSPGRRRTSTP